MWIEEERPGGDPTGWLWIATHLERKVAL